MLCIKSIETEEVKLMLGVSLIIIAAAIVYMVETYISTYYTIEYMHGTSLFLILLAKYGTPVLFLLRLPKQRGKKPQCSALGLSEM